MPESSEVKIFCIYHGSVELPIFATDCIQPIQSGTAINGVRKGAWRDDIGDNISDKNPVWAELCVHYWVLKNWLVQNPQVSHVGFCHYRRHINFRAAPISRFAIVRKLFSHALLFEDQRRFSARFHKAYTQSAVSRCIIGYDVILPGKSYLKQSIVAQYACAGHSLEDIDKLIAIIRRRHPDYSVDMDAFLNGNTAYLWLNFVMRREWLIEFLEWEFDVLTELERESDWAHEASQDSYALARIPAFLAERFFNVWLMHKLRVDGGRLLERQGVMLVNDSRGFFSLNIARAWQMVKVFLASAWRKGN